jgi:hypothetical protein
VLQAGQQGNYRCGCDPDPQAWRRERRHLSNSS